MDHLHKQDTQINDIVGDFIDLLKTPAMDLEKNIKALLSETISRMDLVSQEEMQRQNELLQHALLQIKALEEKIVLLENDSLGQATKMNNTN